MTETTDRVYEFTIQRGRGDRFEEFETHIVAPTIFRAAELLRLECEQKGWWVVSIQEDLPNIKDENTYNHVHLKPKRTVQVEYKRIGKLAARIISDQEPLSEEFEAVWDANKDALYEP